MAAPQLGPAIPIFPPFAGFPGCSEMSRALGANYSPESSDCIAAEQEVALQILANARGHKVISPEDAEKLVEKVFEADNVLREDFRNSIELLAQKIDFRCTILNKAEDVFQKADPAAKKEITSKLAKCELSLIQGNIAESTNLIVDLNLQLDHLQNQQELVESMRNNIRDKITRAQAKIAPPLPLEINSSEHYKIPAEELPPLPLGIERKPLAKPNPRQNDFDPLEVAPPPPPEE